MKADFEDCLIDAKLHIDTVGRNDSFSTDHLYPYEPTSYTVLDKMIESGYITGTDQVLDYGCGKGRVPIYLNHKLGCRTIGVELVDGFFDDAVKNSEKYKKRARLVAEDDISLVHLPAHCLNCLIT